MRISEREVEDAARLEEMIARERDADRRDRARIALLALRGREKLDIAAALGVAKSTVEFWAYRYRDGGVHALRGLPRPGRPPKLARTVAAKLAARLDAGATTADKVCTLRGRDVKRIIKEEFNADISLSSVYRPLHALGYACLAPRPRHEKQDKAAQEKFKEERAPFLSAR